MQATVTSVKDGRVTLIVRRNHRTQILDQRHSNHSDLKVGDKIEVRRQVNNPYLVRV